MVCLWKTGLTCNISRSTVDNTGAEQKLVDAPIYTNKSCKILKVYNKDFSQELANETDKGNILLRVGKLINIEKGDLIDITDKDMGSMGRYRIEEIDPKRFKGRLKSIYLYIKKYNG